MLENSSENEYPSCLRWSRDLSKNKLEASDDKEEEVVTLPLLDEVEVFGAELELDELDGTGDGGAWAGACAGAGAGSVRGGGGGGGCMGAGSWRAGLFLSPRRLCRRGQGVSGSLDSGSVEGT